MYSDYKIFDCKMPMPQFEDCMINSSYKGSSTKRGNNPKQIAKRRKRNKNKKTHRK